MTPQEAYAALIDEAIVTWTLDDRLSAKEQLDSIIAWHIQVASDPRVNGGYRLIHESKQLVTLAGVKQEKVDD